jgi:hypothetical protein
VRDSLGLSLIIEDKVGVLDLGGALHVRINIIDALLELLYKLRDWVG